MTKLLAFKNAHMEAQQQKIEEDLKGDAKNMEVIIDALGEVIRDYLSEKSDVSTDFEEYED